MRKIYDMAHARGVEVMVDGAHTFAQVRHSVSELGCDYYGASLHKWLSAPLGAGVLYVAGHVRTPIWPLLAEPDDGAVGIARLNHTGTAPVHTDLAIGDALDYYTSGWGSIARNPGLGTSSNIGRRKFARCRMWW